MWPGISKRQCYPLFGPGARGKNGEAWPDRELGVSHHTRHGVRGTSVETEIGGGCPKSHRSSNSDILCGQARRGFPPGPRQVH